MARKLRVEYPGAIYHVMNRGDRREPISKDDRDRESFVAMLGETCEKTGWWMHAYCLMPNHFHLVVETPQPNLVAGMKWFLGVYTGRFNRRHRLFGHLFSGRYKALIVDGSGEEYLRTVCEYVHLNPCRAKLLKLEEPLKSFRWSSFGGYLQRPAKRPSWLRVARVFGEMGIPKDSAAGRREFERMMEERRRQDEPEDYRAIRRGWYLGTEAFRKELLEQMEERRGANHYGEELAESEEAKAERLVREGLRRLGWTEAELAQRPKGSPAKVRLALELRRNTTMTLAWIARRLAMGTVGHVNHKLYLEKSNRK